MSLEGMDLENYIRQAIRDRQAHGELLGWIFGANDASTQFIRALSYGIASWLCDRESSLMTKLFSECSAELLERASVKLAEAAIEAAKRENK